MVRLRFEEGWIAKRRTRMDLQMSFSAVHVEFDYTPFLYPTVCPKHPIYRS